MHTNMRSTTIIAALLSASFVAMAQPTGEAWQCDAQPGPFSIWINEARAIDGSKLEVMSVAGAAITYSNIQVLALDANGGVLETRNLAQTCTRTDGLVDGQIIAWTCDNWMAVTPATGGGIALVNNLGTADAGDDLPIQYIGVVNAQPYLGMAPCFIPAGQVDHLVAGGPTVSLQLINAAPYDASINMVNVYGFNWQGILPETWGALNAGQSEWGAFSQTFTDAFLQAPPNGDPATVGGDPNEGPVGECTYGEFTDWSACSLVCQKPGGEAQAGVRVKYQPILTFPTGGGLDDCTPIEERMEEEACVPVSTCTTCQNEVRDSPETDIDCGGGAPRRWPIDTPIREVISDIAQGIPTNSSGSSPTRCARCLDGRNCSMHEDCANGAGLLCANRTCTPFWFLNNTWFVDFTVTLPGFGPDVLTGMAWDIYRITVAEVASLDSATVAPKDVSATSVKFYPAAAAATRRMLISTDVDFKGEQHNSGTTRVLATADDILSVGTRVRADSEAEAIAVARNIRENMDMLIGLLRERLRLFAPQIGTPTVGTPNIVRAPYSGILGPEVSTSDTSLSGLSTGAIIGIAVGCAAAVGLIAVGLIAAARRRREEPVHQRRGQMNIGDGQAANDPYADPSKRKVDPNHTKAAFAPERANIQENTSDVVESSDKHGSESTLTSAAAVQRTPSASRSNNTPFTEAGEQESKHTPTPTPVVAPTPADTNTRRSAGMMSP